VVTNPPNTWNTIIELKLSRSYNTLNFQRIPPIPLPIKHTITAQVPALGSAGRSLPMQPSHPRAGKREETSSDTGILHFEAR